MNTLEERKGSEDNNELRNATWDHNHGRIRDEFLKILKAKNGRKPTVEELAAATSLHATTIRKHIKSLKFEPARHVGKFLTDDVLMSIFKSAIKGNAPSQKLWFELMEGFAQKQEIGITQKEDDPLARMSNDELTRELQKRLDRIKSAGSSDGSESM